MSLILAGIGGFVAGFVYAFIYDITHKTCGIIEVDHSTEQCKVHITSGELTNRKVKKAVFVINHDANISREEQIL